MHVKVRWWDVLNIVLIFPGGVVDSVTKYKIKEEMLPESKPGFH